MPKNTKIEWIFLLLAIATPFIYLNAVYHELPQTIPTHFNLQGKVDAYGHKSTLLFTTILLSFIEIIVYFLVKFAHKIDPKKAAGQSPELLKKIAISILIFLCGIQLMIIHASIAMHFEGVKYLYSFIGIFFAVIGNFMHSIKPNYFIGFRIPWTLENEDNWRRTHYFVSKIWVACGILIAGLVLIDNQSINLILSGSIFLLMIVSPFIYSYQLYKKK